MTNYPPLEPMVLFSELEVADLAQTLQGFSGVVATIPSP